MRRKKVYHMIRGCSAAAWLVPLGMPAHGWADASAGQALFNSRCAQCHRAGPASLRTPTAQLPALLQGGTVSRHRFALSDAQLADLVAYLTEIKAGGH